MEGVVNCRCERGRLRYAGGIVRPPARPATEGGADAKQHGRLLATVGALAAP